MAYERPPILILLRDLLSDICAGAVIDRSIFVAWYRFEGVLVFIVSVDGGLPISLSIKDVWQRTPRIRRDFGWGVAIVLRGVDFEIALDDNE